jgi:hypothetical protein
MDSDGNLTTTYAILHGKKPRISRFKVFGCPVLFKKYNSQKDGETTSKFKELQQGARGIFVGFQDDQAGWLIFIQQKISGWHLIISMDVMFDQMFLTGITASIKGFGNSQDTRKIGNLPTKTLINTKNTGDVTNLADFQMSHWGCNETFESDHQMWQEPTTTSTNNNKEDHNRSMLQYMATNHYILFYNIS